MIAVQKFEESPNCSDRRFNFAIGIAERLSELGAEDLIVWYDKYEDYTKVEFTFGERRYHVQIYKIFALYLEGKCHGYFQWEHDFIHFFEGGRWKEKLLTTF